MLLIACVAASLTAAQRANAQDLERSWRRSDPPPQSPQRFAFELRFGPYRPQIDDNFPASKPFETVFGTDRRFCFGVEFDWQVLRIPKFGTLGPGFGWSYTHFGATAKKLGSEELSAEQTNIGIMPMYGVAVLRFDELARDTVIPLVAYGKAGVGYGLWWTGTDSGTQARGHTWGTQFALGGMFLLDVLDQHAATELDNEWGINSSYLFFEWMNANLNGFAQMGDTSVLKIGTQTWVMGLAFEM